MSDKRNTGFIVRQAAVLAIVGIAARLLGFLYRLPLTDLIGDEGNAIYGFGYAVYNFFLVISSAGLPAAMSKLVSEQRAKGRYDTAHLIFKTALAIAAVAGIFFTAFIFLFARDITEFFGHPESYLALQTLAPTVFIFAIMATIRGYFQGMSSTGPTATSQFVEQFFNAIFSIVLAHAMWNFAAQRGYMQQMYGAAGGTMGTTMGAFAGFIVISGLYFIARPQIISETRQARRISKVKKLYTPPKTKLASSIFLTSSTIIAGTAIFSIVNLIDTWLVIDRLYVAGFEPSPARELFGQLTGKFNPITNLPAAISSSLAMVLIPSIAAARAVGDDDDVKIKVNTAFRAAMLITFPIAFGLFALGPQIVAFLFPNHPYGGTLFTVGFASVIFLAISQISTGVLQAIGKISIPIASAIIGAIGKIVISFVLIAIPGINIYGAIIGTTLCYLIAALINCRYLCKYTGVKFDFKGIALKPTIAGIAMVLGCFAIYHLAYIISGSNAIGVILAVFGGALIYGGFMILIKGFNEDDFKVLPKGHKLASFLKSRGVI